MTTLSIQMTADRDNLIASLALAQDLMSAADSHRQHVASTAKRQIAGAAFELLYRAVG